MKKTTQLHLDSGKDVTVIRLPLRRYGEILEALSNLFESISTLTQLTEQEVVAQIPTLVRDNMPQLASLMAMVTDATEPEILNDWTLRDLTAVLKSALEVNAFAEVIENLKGISGKLNPPAPKAAAN